MGGTLYSHANRTKRATTKGYYTKSREEVFSQRQIHPDMNPKGVKLREARDSEAHPNSIPVIIAMDVTASMGRIPHQLVKDGLPKIISTIIEAGIPDPQIMFMAIGDHRCDSAPLQISQFESGDEELDMWLTNVYLEGGGGGNGGESYSLAHYFANSVCVSDNWEKRNKKGYIFTIGDEANHDHYPSNRLERIFGESVEAFDSNSQLELAKEKWNVFHIVPGNANYNEQGYWKKFLGENALYLETSEEVDTAIATTVVNNELKTDNETVTHVKDMKGENSDDSKSESNDPKITL